MILEVPLSEVPLYIAALTIVQAMTHTMCSKASEKGASIERMPPEERTLVLSPFEHPSNNIVPPKEDSL